MKNNKAIKLLFSILAIAVSGCASGSIRIREKVELVDPIEPRPLNPITDEIRALAATKAPSLDPKNVIYSKLDNYDFSNQAYLNVDLQSSDLSIREGHSLIYLFRGSINEGYNGVYYNYYANIYLWEDGFATGISHNETFKGYWYNDEDGDGIITDADNLGIVCDPSAYEKYSNIVCEKGEYFYDWRASIYLNNGYGDRSVLLGGYLYYETIAIAIESNKTGTNFAIGDSFDIRMWSVYEIHQNLEYTYAFERDDIEAMQIRWIIPEGLVMDNRMAKAGTFAIKATYNNFETSTLVFVE